jgi:hypothetical protein
MTQFYVPLLGTGRGKFIIYLHVADFALVPNISVG